MALVPLCPIPPNHPALRPQPVIFVDQWGIPWRDTEQKSRYSLEEAKALMRLGAQVYRFRGDP